MVIYWFCYHFFFFFHAIAANHLSFLPSAPCLLVKDYIFKVKVALIEKKNKNSA